MGGGDTAYLTQLQQGATPSQLAAQQYSQQPGAVPTTMTPTSPTVTTTPQPLPAGTTTPTSFLPSGGQDQLYQQSLNSIFNPQPAAGFQLDMSNFPFINESGGASISTPNVSVGSISPGSFGGNLGQGTAMTQLPPDIISQGQSQQAVEGLLNPKSLFDMMSGGPIVDEINQRTNSLQDAFRTQQMGNLDEGIAKIRAQLAAEGVLSGSDIINEQFDFTQGVLNDIAVTEAGYGLEATKYLGDLAMQDLQMQSNNLQRVLVEANLQRGMNIQAAVADADRKSREIIAQAEIQARIAEANLQAQTQASIANAQMGSNAAIANAQLQAQRELGNLDAAQALQLAQLQSQTNLALGGQSAGVDILQLMQQDYANQQAQNLGVQQLPLNTLGGLSGPMNLSSSSSKSI